MGYFRFSAMPLIDVANMRRLTCLLVHNSHHSVTGAPLTLSDLKHDVELKRRIVDWRLARSLQLLLS